MILNAAKCFNRGSISILFFHWTQYNKVLLLTTVLSLFCHQSFKLYSTGPQLNKGPRPLLDLILYNEVQVISWLPKEKIQVCFLLLRMYILDISTLVQYSVEGDAQKRRQSKQRGILVLCCGCGCLSTPRSCYQCGCSLRLGCTWLLPIYWWWFFKCQELLMPNANTF